MWLERTVNWLGKNLGMLCIMDTSQKESLIRDMRSRSYRKERQHWKLTSVKSCPRKWENWKPVAQNSGKHKGTNNDNDYAATK